MSEYLGLCQVTSVLHGRLHNAIKTHQAVLKQLCEHIRLYGKSHFVPRTVTQQHTYTHFVSQMLSIYTFLYCWHPKAGVSFFFSPEHCSCHGMPWQIFCITISVHLSITNPFNSLVNAQYVRHVRKVVKSRCLDNVYT